jgi:hypothetical protein
MPVQELTVRLDRGDRAGHHVLPTEQTLDFCLDTRDGTRAELAQELAIEACVQSQPFTGWTRPWSRMRGMPELPARRRVAVELQ